MPPSDSAEYKAAWKEAFPVSTSGTVEEMAPFLDSPFPGIRSRMLRSLGKRHPAEAVPLLIEAAGREDDDSVRLSIALALRDLEEPRSSEALWSLFEEGTREVRWAALQGLSRLGDEDVIPIAVSWCRSGDRISLSIGVFDLALLQSRTADRALADLLAAETSWRRRRSIRQAMRRAERWLARHG
jgi:HEAT repeat protein